ncbi:MAG: hypothetical protein WC260_00435 [Candidatus Pacearchaeota archaeon]
MKKFRENIKKRIKKSSKLILLITNTILLTIVYFLGIGITFLIGKLTRKKLFNLDLNKDEKTYWEKIKEEKKSLEDFYNPF